MNKQIHFVVMYDTSTNEFVMDYDTQDSKFDGKPIFNLEADSINGFDGWERIDEEELADDNSEYCRSADALHNAIKNLTI